MTEEHLKNKPLKVMIKFKKQLFTKDTRLASETYVGSGSEDLTQSFAKPEGFVIPAEGQDFIMESPTMTFAGHVNRVVNHFQYAEEDESTHTQIIGVTLVTFEDLDKYKKSKK